MNPSIRLTKSAMKTHRILSTTIASLLLAFPLPAATVTWDGGGGNNLISNMVNWNPDGAPLNDGSATLQFDGAVRLAPNFGAAFSAAGITFLNTADAFVLGGSTITIGTGGFLNSDTQTQTIDNNVTVGTATSAFNAANGALAFNGTVALGANPLAVNGAFATTFGGAITGTGTITKSAAGAMNLNATATAIGADFNLTGGTTTLVATGTAQTLSSTSAVAVSATGAFAINESLMLDGAQLTRDATSALSIAGFKTITMQNGGDVIIAGGLTTLSQSTIIVTGAGSTFTTTSSLQFAGGNTTNVLAGGSLSAGAGSITIGVAGTGTVTVDGAGSSIIGGALLVSGGGSNSSLTLTNGSSGSFATIQVDNTISAGTVGTFSIQSGATVTGTALSVSTFAGVNTGAVTVTGAGSAFTLTGAATAAIGAPSLSTGTLTIQNGTFTSGTGTTTLNTTGTITTVEPRTSSARSCSAAAR